MGYNAFISYSHTADGALAAALQSALHRFAKPWYKLRGLHIFRDQTNLAVNPALWSSIREALDQSSFFILLASPESAASPWVAQEAEYWMGRNGPSKVLIVLTGGTLKWDHAAASFTPEDTSALPASLLRSFAEEPLFLDLLWVRGSSARLRMREPRFHEAVLQLASTLRNRPKDELDSADIHLQRETRWIAAFGLIAILLTGLFAMRQTHLSHEEFVRNLAAKLAATSAKVLADNPGQTREAALLAIESNRLNASFEANQALRAAVSLLPGGAQFYRGESADLDQRIRDMAFSPDSATLAVVRDEGSTQLLDVTNHKPIGYFTPNEQPAASIDLTGKSQDQSPDDDNVDNAVSVAFSSNGSLIASGARNGFVHIWSFPGARELLRISVGSPIRQIAFHPKANRLVTASEDGHVRIFDVARAAMLFDLKCPGEVASASFSPDGDLLAALSSEGPVYLFDPVQGKPLRKLYSGGDAAFNVVFSHYGKRLATAAGNFAFVWDATTGRLLLKATHAASSETLATREWIDDAAISSDGKFLAYTARGDSLAHVWNVETGRQILELHHGSRVAAVSFNGDGTKLGTGSFDGTSRVWELPSGRELERAAHVNGAEVVAFSPNGNRFAAGGMNGSVSVSEMRRADRPAFFDLPDGISGVAFSPDGRRFAIGARSIVRIADIGGNVLRDIELHGPPALDKLVFLDPNRLIAQWSTMLFLINIDQSSVTRLPQVTAEPRIDPSGKMLAIQRDGVSRVYSLPELKQITSLPSPSPYLLRSADEGRLLAFETRNPPNASFVDIWNVARQARVSRISPPAEVNKVALNPAGTILFTAESERLQAWDIPSGKRRFSLTAGGDIRLIVPDPSSAAVATLDGHLTVWDAVTGARLAELPRTQAAVFSPDGRYLLSEYGERSAALWLWRSGDLRDEACGRLTSNLSHQEWERSFPGQQYRLICPNLPAAK
jgi:WD40 repeat protein